MLTADAFLSGLSDTEHNVAREKARVALHPTPVEVQAKLKMALDELRTGVEAAKRMVLERCGLRLDDDGVARGIREPLSKAQGPSGKAA